MDAILNIMPDLTPALLEYNQSWLPWIFGGGLLWAIIAYFVGETKGNGCLGCILGFVLGPFGILITALLGRNRE